MMGAEGEAKQESKCKDRCQIAKEKCQKKGFQTEETKAPGESFAPPTKIKSSRKLTIGNRH